MFRRGWNAAFLLSAVLGFCPLSISGPIPENERISVDLRRTTLVVRDIEKSIPLYRDALGMTVIYDQVIGGTTRLVLLRANDDFVGVLGLMQRLNLAEPAPPPTYHKAKPGEHILVFNVKDLDERFPLIRSTPYVTVSESPKRIDYPSANGGTIPVIFSAVWDADGNFIELNRIIGSPAGTK